MKKIFKTVALGFVLSSIGLMAATDAGALPGFGYRIVYFADASMTYPKVGVEVLTCSGTHTLIGERTEYYTQEDLQCSPPPSPFPRDPEVPPYGT